MSAFKVGDLVWIAHHCALDSRCARDYGIIFKIAHTANDGPRSCVRCGWRKMGQFVQYSGGWTPASFLRLIDPDALIKTEPTHEKEIA